MRIASLATLLVAVTFTFVGNANAQSCCNDSCCRKMTLMQWSYGTSFSGGPDLSEPLVTDRPDFTEAASTVGLHVGQLEMGYTYTFDNDGTGNRSSHSIGEPLLRYGVLADWFELRLGWNYAEETSRPMGGTSTGAEDLYLGVKLGLTPQECLLPETALILQATVPTGSSAFQSDEVLPGFNYIYAWAINDRLSTAGSSQFNRAEDTVTGDRYVEFAQSWTMSYSLTDRIGTYGEYFGLIPTGADTVTPQHYMNGGFTYLVHNDLQLDIRAGVGLNDSADDYFIGTGLSYRF